MLAMMAMSPVPSDRFFGGGFVGGLKTICAAACTRTLTVFSEAGSLEEGKDPGGLKRASYLTASSEAGSLEDDAGAAARGPPRLTVPHGAGSLEDSRRHYNRVALRYPDRPLQDGFVEGRMFTVRDPSARGRHDCLSRGGFVGGSTALNSSSTASEV